MSPRALTTSLSVEIYLPVGAKWLSVLQEFCPLAEPLPDEGLNSDDPETRERRTRYGRARHALLASLLVSYRPLARTEYQAHI